jgi:hypothetical protein
MTILAIDPGPERSTAVVFRHQGPPQVFDCTNSDMRNVVWKQATVAVRADVCVIEQVESYGMAVGREVFNTVFWAGRFAELWYHARLDGAFLLPRAQVKLTLCGSKRAKDANIRQALIDRYGGKAHAIGTKAAPGLLYGVKSHAWAALALAVTHHELTTAAIGRPA